MARFLPEFLDIQGVLLVADCAMKCSYKLELNLRFTERDLMNLILKNLIFGKRLMFVRIESSKRFG